MQDRTTSRETPGPGNYDQTSLFKYNEDHGMGNQMVPRRPISAMESLGKPGPGAYNPGLSQSKIRGATHKIGTNPRGKLDREGVAKPGPGTYDPSDSYLGHSPPRYGFGTGKRRNLGGENLNPGPGNYEDFRRIGDGPRYVMGMKTEQSGKGLGWNPGPGAYDPNINSSKINTSKIGIGTSQRDGLYKNGVPGSGAYDSDASAIKKAAPKFGKIKFLNKRFRDPGSIGELQFNEARAGTRKL